MLNFTLNEVPSAWCVYTLANVAGEIVFIRHSKLTAALAMSDVWSVPDLDRTMRHIFNVMDVYRTQLEAEKAVNEWIRFNYFPIYNRLRTSHYKAIKCNETNVIYRNQSEAVRALGLNKSRLSHHLRGYPGARSVQGFTFSYVSNPQPYIQPVQFPPFTPSNPAQILPGIPQPSSGDSYFAPRFQKIPPYPTNT